jgi:hypothetical protein
VGVGVGVGDALGVGDGVPSPLEESLLLHPANIKAVIKIQS